MTFIVKARQNNISLKKSMHRIMSLYCDYFIVTILCWGGFSKTLKR